MVVLDVKLDNFYAFKNFHMNLTYPKKIVGSSIKEEHLAGRSNFRYKKVNILLGANATGKSTFGRILMKIFNFVKQKNYTYITQAIGDTKQEASFTLDLASSTNIFYRIKCIVLPFTGEEYQSSDIKIQIISEPIKAKDSYEICTERIANIEFQPSENYVEELEKIEELSWFFQYPEDGKRTLRLPNKDEGFCRVLANVLKVLDPAIKDVTISQDVDKAYVVHLQNRSIVLQDGETFDTDFLSSGTKNGVEIASIISSLIRGTSNFYYCDEKFSYIHSDVEKALLSVMIDFVDNNDQIFFTTHNTDILDMNLPKHSFTFLRKDITDTEHPIVPINVASYLKRNTDSIRHAVENDSFSTSPALEPVYDIIIMNDEG